MKVPVPNASARSHVEPEVDVSIAGRGAGPLASLPCDDNKAAMSSAPGDGQRHMDSGRARARRLHLHHLVMLCALLGPASTALAGTVEHGLDPKRLNRAPVSTFVVTNTNDSGPGSLRQALLDANASPGMDRIEFAIGGGGLQTISPSSALPALTEAVEIDATTQPGFAGAPLIELDGSSAGTER